MSEASISAEVNRELRRFFLLAPPEAKRFNRTQNRIHAQRLDDALHKVETLLASAPGPLIWFLLNPRPGMKGGLPDKTQAVENIERANRQRAESFAAELKRLRQVCASGVDPGFGNHPNFDPAKYICPFFAYGLMEALSDRAITGTKDDAFRVITSLLYEAISGQQGADLKRACDSCLSEIRRTPKLV